MPNVSSGTTTSSSSSTSSGSTTLQVVTDTARGQGVLVTEAGARLDISAVEDDGTTASCSDPVGVALVNDTTSGLSASSTKTAIIAGTRKDGTPGAWAYASGKIQGVIDEDSGALTSCLPPTDERDRTLRGPFGWIYHVMGVSEDGKIIIGYAENKKGFSWGSYTIDPGTTVGVYWQVSHHPRRPFLMVSRAHVIGVLETGTQPGSKKGHHWLNWVYRHWLELLKKFFLNYYTDYLVMVDKDGVHFDSAMNVYLVSGTDQDDQAAVATIDKQGAITIKETTTQANVDLLPASITTAASSVAQGSSLAVTLTVKNLQSGAVTQSFGVDFYLALSSTFSPGTDSHLGSATVNGIGGSSSAAVNASLTIPSLGADSNQDIYIYAVVDSAGVVTETDTTNNTSTATTAAIVLVYDSSNASRAYKVLLQTYAPTGSGSVDTAIGLWRQTSSSTATSIASVNSMGAGPGFASLDLSSTPLTPGTYSVVVISWSNYGGYAMSARTPNVAASTFSTSLSSNSQDPYEPDDTPQIYPITSNLTSLPTAPAALPVGSVLNRYSAAGDWDWFTFTLP